jgi:hypothetical protein
MHLIYLGTNNFIKINIKLGRNSIISIRLSSIIMICNMIMFKAMINLMMILIYIYQINII